MIDCVYQSPFFPLTEEKADNWQQISKLTQTIKVK